MRPEPALHAIEARPARWASIADTREGRRAHDSAYRNVASGERLLVRYSRSVTARRLRQARTILAQADFDWVVLVPESGAGASQGDDPRLAIIAARDFVRIAQSAGLL